MADTVQQLLRSRVGDSTPAVKYGSRVWTWREHLADASAAADAGRRVRLIETHGAAPDHPEIVTLPETIYLKCLILQVL